MMPLNVCAVIAKHTGVAGRKFRGRFFFGGFPLTWAVGANPNELDGGVVTAQAAVWDAFYASIVSTGCVPVLLHQTGGPAPTQIQRFDVHPLLGNMRKRIR
jgi:hypothetical protein